MFLDSKHAEAHFSPNATDSLYLLVAQVPRPRDMVIFVLTTTTTTMTTTTTRPITLSLAHARGVITGAPTASMMSLEHPEAIISVAPAEGQRPL